MAETQTIGRRLRDGESEADAIARAHAWGLEAFVTIVTAGVSEGILMVTYRGHPRPLGPKDRKHVARRQERGDA